MERAEKHTLKRKLMLSDPYFALCDRSWQAVLDTTKKRNCRKQTTSLILILCFERFQHSFKDIAHMDTVIYIQFFHVNFQDRSMVKTELDHI